ncbi:MAG: hypothetical protein QNJ22_09095 [Desulfosarcinaceae bacterium]|nr:hypothetical protein [Desulfosarcinaceae bacterium]
MQITLFLKKDKSSLVAFSSVLHHGFQVNAMVGCSIKELLCDQFEVAEEILKHRIQTLLLDGKPLDDEERATVKGGATIALSIALGGMVGVSLRKGGHLTNIRSTITHQEKETVKIPSTEGMVTIKLFNQLAGELGPLFLKKGLWVQKNDAMAILKDRLAALRSFIIKIEKDGMELTPDQLSNLNWSEVPAKVLLKAFLRPPENDPKVV